MGRVGLHVLGGSWEAQAEVVVTLCSQSREVHPQTCPRYFPWPTLAVCWGLSQSKARRASLLRASHAECVGEPCLPLCRQVRGCEEESKDARTCFPGEMCPQTGLPPARPEGEGACEWCSWAQSP